eukprot:TRINITY_DN6970_c0_g1_i1.p1 TRINITY_DN6970_c0_g1~~TRINITY_DN6970_c0_g1_i1.p1  ORF type:complete len:446 (-),score=85.92 TRINITY_DN6970_c0_g1_i1:37-1374(-)
MERRTNRRLRVLVILFVIIFFVVYGSGFLKLGSGEFSPTNTPTKTPTEVPTKISTETPTEVEVPEDFTDDTTEVKPKNLIPGLTKVVAERARKFGNILSPICKPKEDVGEKDVVEIYQDADWNMDWDEKNFAEICRPYSYARFNMGKLFKNRKTVECENNTISSQKGIICNWYPMCIWPREEDKHVSATIKDGKFWKEKWTREMVDALENYDVLGRQAMFVDIGAGLGQDSFIAAALGYPVVSVEPLADAVDMFKRTLSFSNFMSRVLIFQNALGDHIRDASVNFRSDDRSLSTLLPYQDEEEEDEEEEDHHDKRHRGGVVVKQVELDDLLPAIIQQYPTADVAFMKADLGGSEPRLFRGAAQFLSYYEPSMIHIELQGKEMEVMECSSVVSIKSFQKLGYKVLYENNEGKLVSLDAKTTTPWVQKEVNMDTKRALILKKDKKRR